MRKNATPRPAGAQGKGAKLKTAEHKYTLIGASEKLLGCLILAYQYGTLHEALANALPHLEGVSLPNRDGELLNALKYLAENNIPYDDESLKSAAQSVGYTDTATLSSYVVQAIDTQLDYLQTAREKGRYLAEMAGHYAREARRAWLRRQIQAIASQLYNNPDSAPEALERLQSVCQSVCFLNTPPVKQTETKPWRVITARELVEMELPQLEPLPLLGQEGFLYQGCAHLLVAHPKAGKTQVILHSACQWLEQGMRVAILYEEGQALMQYRLKTQASLQPVVRNELLFVELDCPLSGEVLKALDAELKADIYVVDTARAFLPIRNENDNAELAAHHYPLVRASQEIGKTLIMLHHAPQELPVKVALRSAGGLATAGAYDMIIAIEEIQRGDDFFYRVQAEGRLKAPQPFEYRWENDTLVLEAVAPYTQRLRTAVIRALMQLHQLYPDTAYFGTREIQDLLEIDGNPTPRQVIDALLQLAQQGAVEESPTRGVRNTRLWRLVSSLFPEGDLRENKLTDADTPPTPPESSDSALTTAYTRARALYRPAGDIEAIIERLQRNTEYPLSEDEAERMRAVYALAESLGYPALELPDWNLAIDATRVDWVNALPVLAGTDALDDALRALLTLQNAESSNNPPLSEDSEVLEGDALVVQALAELGRPRYADLVQYVGRYGMTPYRLREILEQLAKEGRLAATADELGRPQEFYLRSAGEPAEAIQRKTLRNGSEGVSPASALQLTLTEVP